jgi:Tol biopolymer transport system component
LIALAIVGFGHRWGRGAGQSREGASALAPISLPPAHANGVLTIEVRHAGGVINPDTLAVINPDGFGLRPLTRCPATIEPGGCGFGGYAWSPDGKRLAFLSGHFGGAITRSNLLLSVINADGTGRRLIAHCGDCNPSQNLSWSPDSRRIVFASGPNFVGGYLRIVNVVTGAQRHLGFLGINPAWSPAGARIAFGRSNVLYSIKPDGSGMTKLAIAAGDVGEPAWSPDGGKVAFDGPDKIYVVDADGSHLRLLVAGPSGSGPGTPSWSPRGNHILFLNTPQSAGGYTAEVWLMKPDGSGQHRVYHSGCCEIWSPPIWSPDGKAIALGMSAYTTNGISRKGILVMDPQGNHRRALLGNPTAIAWQPIPRAR